MARPAQFEREEVLEKAMQAFWDHGYRATSMADLVEATELKPGSLYAAFRSKEGLFLAALDHYAQHSVARLEQALTGARSPLQGIRGYFRQLAKDVATHHGRRGCLLVNTVLELSRQDDVVRKRVNQHLGTIEALLRRTLEVAQARGELAADRDPAALATFLLSNIWGLRVLAGTAPARTRTEAVVNQVLAVLD
jgi:TetR/AcrR family transcriptional repressor of nem operon